MRREDGSYYGVVWNPDHDGSGSIMENQYGIHLPENSEGEEFCLIRRTVDEEHGNPLKTWHELGGPANPTREEMDLLRLVAHPEMTSDTVTVENNCLHVKVSLHANGVQAFELRPVERQQDAGYDYERTVFQRMANNTEREL